MEDVTFHIEQAFASKRVFAEADLRHTHSARRCTELQTAISHLENAMANSTIIDAVRQDLEEETAACKRLQQALEVARKEFIGLLRAFAMDMSAVFCAYNMLVDPCTTDARAMG